MADKIVGDISLLTSKAEADVSRLTGRVRTLLQALALANTELAELDAIPGPVRGIASSNISRLDYETKRHKALIADNMGGPRSKKGQAYRASLVPLDFPDHKAEVDRRERQFRSEFRRSGRSVTSAKRAVPLWGEASNRIENMVSGASLFSRAATDRMDRTEYRGVMDNFQLTRRYLSATGQNLDLPLHSGLSHAHRRAAHIYVAQAGLAAAQRRQAEKDATSLAGGTFYRTSLNYRARRMGIDPILDPTGVLSRDEAFRARTQLVQAAAKNWEAGQAAREDGTLASGIGLSTRYQRASFAAGGDFDKKAAAKPYTGTRKELAIKEAEAAAKRVEMERWRRAKAASRAAIAYEKEKEKQAKLRLDAIKKESRLDGVLNARRGVANQRRGFFGMFRRVHLDDTQKQWLADSLGEVYASGDGKRIREASRDWGWLRRRVRPSDIADMEANYKIPGRFGARGGGMGRQAVAGFLGGLGGLGGRRFLGQTAMLMGRMGLPVIGAGAAGAAYGTYALTSTALHNYSQLEAQKLFFAGLVNTGYQFNNPLTGKPVSTGAANFANAQAYANSLFGKVRQVAVESPLTAQELFKAFSVGLPFLSNKGLSTDESLKVVNRVASVGKLLGLRPESFQDDLRALSTGIYKNVQSFQAVGVTREGFQALSRLQGEDLVQAIDGYFKKFDEAIERYDKTYLGAVSRLQDAWFMLTASFGETMAPTMVNIMETLTGWINQMQENRVAERVREVLNKVYFFFDGFIAGLTNRITHQPGTRSAAIAALEGTIGGKKVSTPASRMGRSTWDSIAGVVGGTYDIARTAIAPAGRTGDRVEFAWHGMTEGFDPDHPLASSAAIRAYQNRLTDVSGARILDPVANFLSVVTGSVGGGGGVGPGGLEYSTTPLTSLRTSGSRPRYKAMLDEANQDMAMRVSDILRSERGTDWTGFPARVAVPHTWRPGGTRPVDAGLSYVELHLEKFPPIEDMSEYDFGTLNQSLPYVVKIFENAVLAGKSLQEAKEILSHIPVAAMGSNIQLLEFRSRQHVYNLAKAAEAEWSANPLATPFETKEQFALRRVQEGQRKFYAGLMTPNTRVNPPAVPRMSASARPAPVRLQFNDLPWLRRINALQIQGMGAGANDLRLSELSRQASRINDFATLDYVARMNHANTVARIQREASIAGIEFDKERSNILFDEVTGGAVTPVALDEGIRKLTQEQSELRNRMLALARLELKDEYKKAEVRAKLVEAEINLLTERRKVEEQRLEHIKKLESGERKIAAQFYAELNEFPDMRRVAATQRRNALLDLNAQPGAWSTVVIVGGRPVRIPSRETVLGYREANLAYRSSNFLLDNAFRDLRESNFARNVDVDFSERESYRTFRQELADISNPSMFESMPRDIASLEGRNNALNAADSEVLDRLRPHMVGNPQAAQQYYDIKQRIDDRNRELNNARRANQLADARNQQAMNNIMLDSRKHQFEQKSHIRDFVRTGAVMSRGQYRTFRRDAALRGIDFAERLPRFLGGLSPAAAQRAREEVENNYNRIGRSGFDRIATQDAMASAGFASLTAFRQGQDPISAFAGALPDPTANQWNILTGDADHIRGLISEGKLGSRTKSVQRARMEAAAHIAASVGGTMLAGAIMPKQSYAAEGSAIMGMLAPALGLAGPWGALAATFGGGLLGGLFRKRGPNPEDEARKRHQQRLEELLSSIDKKLSPQEDYYRTMDRGAVFGSASRFYSGRAYSGLGLQVSRGII